MCNKEGPIKQIEMQMQPTVRRFLGETREYACVPDQIQVRPSHYVGERNGHKTRFSFWNNLITDGILKGTSFLKPLISGSERFSSI